MENPKPCPTCGAALHWGPESLIGPTAICERFHIFVVKGGQSWRVVVAIFSSPDLTARPMVSIELARVAYGHSHDEECDHLRPGAIGRGVAADHLDRAAHYRAFLRENPSGSWDGYRAHMRWLVASSLAQARAIRECDRCGEPLPC